MPYALCQKIFSVCLTFILLFACISCNNDSNCEPEAVSLPSSITTASSPTKTTQSSKIILTTDNIEDYLAVKGYIEKSTNSENTFFTFSVYPVSSGTFQNVQIELISTLPSGWRVSSSDSAYSNSITDQIHYNTLKATVKLSASGETEERHAIVPLNTAVNDPVGVCDVTILAVKGTFIPEEQET